MKKFLFVCVATGLFLSGNSGAGHATVINEIEPNNTLSTAQNVDLSFSICQNIDIFGADTNYPWVSIIATGDGSYDYYSFTVIAGTTGYFDIDYGAGYGGMIDTEIGLWDSSGNVLHQRDDGSTYQASYDQGTFSVLDPSIHYLFTSSGRYIVGVAEYNANAMFGGWTGDTPDFGDDYRLQISLTSHINPVPEPATMLLLGTGLSGIVGVARRKKIRDYSPSKNSVNWFPASGSS